MANTKLTFYGTERSSTEDHELTCFSNASNNIFIEVNSDLNSEYHSGWICLDKSTAIKFAKTLRTEINKIK